MTTLTPNEFATQLLTLAQNESFEQLEQTWMQELANIPTMTGFHKQLLQTLRKKGQADKGLELVLMLTEDKLEKNKVKAAMRVLVAAITCYPHNDQMRGVLLSGLRAFYGQEEQFEEVLAQSGLEGDILLTEGFKAFQALIRMTPGHVYQHYDWGEGVVQSLDLDTRKVTLLFPGELEKVMTIEGVLKFLQYIEPGSFLARKATEPETLGKLAEVDPAEVVKLALAGAPEQELKQGDLKALLSPGLIDAGQWNSWWNKAREALLLDPYIDFENSGGARAVLRLRKKPRSFQQEVKDQFFTKGSDSSVRADLIRQLAKRTNAQQEISENLVRDMARQLKADFDHIADEHPVTKLEIAYMLQDLAQAAPSVEVPQVDLKPILSQITDYAPLFEIDNVDYGIKAITVLLERDGDEGCRKATALLPKAPVKLAQSIWKALDEEHHLDMAVRALQQLLERPLDNPDTYMWAIRSILDGSWEHLEDYFPAAAMVPELMDNMEEWQNAQADGKLTKAEATVARSLLTRARTLLAAGKFEVIGVAVEDMNIETINRLRRTIQTHPALPDTFKSGAERIIRLTRRDLADGEVPFASSASRDNDVHQCTPLGQYEKANELREISSVKIPENSRVIDEARREGDLRENAGYQYAKEEQKMLLQTQATLSTLLAQAQIITADMVDPSAVCFGVQMRAQNLKTDSEETYTILGRWEANPENHVLSIQAPLAQQLLGHKVGDTVTIEHPGGGSTDYQILEITNAMATGRWNAPE